MFLNYLNVLLKTVHWMVLHMDHIFKSEKQEIFVMFLSWNVKTLCCLWGVTCHDGRLPGYVSWPDKNWPGFLARFLEDNKTLRETSSAKRFSGYALVQHRWMFLYNDWILQNKKSKHTQISQNHPLNLSNEGFRHWDFNKDCVWEKSEI